MASWFINSVGYAAVVAWAASTTLAVGAIRRPLTTPAVGNERVYRVSAITTGTTGASEPSWPTGKASTVVDDGVTWTEITGNSTYNISAPHARCANAAAWGTAGDTFFIGDTHAETQASDINISWPGTLTNPSWVLCVDATKTAPGPGDLRTGATISATGIYRTITVTGSGVYVYGLSYRVGTVASDSGAGFTMGGDFLVHTKCSIVFLNVYYNRISMGGASGAYRYRWIDVSVTFAAYGGCSVGNAGGEFEWLDSPTGIVAMPYTTSGLILAGGYGFTSSLRGVDISLVNSGSTIVGDFGGIKNRITLVDCKIGASVATMGRTDGVTSHTVDLIRCNSNGNFGRMERWDGMGQHVPETTLVRTGGDAGATPQSWKITTNAYSSYGFPFETLPIQTWNPTTGSNVTVTVHGIWYSSTGALPTDGEIAIAVDYLGTSGSVVTTRKTSAKATILTTAANLTASTAAWESLVTARANSTSYAQGALIKVASAGGVTRVFYKENAGSHSSASSLPAGYATAVDGDAITDGSCTFRALVRFQMAVTLTSPQPQIAGPLSVIGVAMKPSSIFYLDPCPVLT